MNGLHRRHPRALQCRMRFLLGPNPRTVRPVETLRWLTASLLLSATLLGTSALSAGAQETTPAAGCTLHKDVYTCNLNAFRARLADAHTVAIETQANDRFTATQLRNLTRELGKKVATSDEAADLTFLVIPTETPAIQFGPAGQTLATLRIYAPAQGSGHGALLWAETWTGQPDRPWPAIVHELIGQFQARLAQR